MEDATAVAYTLHPNAFRICAQPLYQLVGKILLP